MSNPSETLRLVPLKYSSSYTEDDNCSAIGYALPNHEHPHTHQLCSGSNRLFMENSLTPLEEDPSFGYLTCPDCACLAFTFILNSPDQLAS